MRKPKLVLAIAAILTVIICALRPAEEKPQTASNENIPMISTAGFE